MTAVPAPLEELAELHGVQTSYFGNDGHMHRADPEILVAVLGALGIGVRDAGDAPDALDAARAAEQAPGAAPVAVAWEGRSAPVRVVVQRGDAAARARLVPDGDSRPAGARDCEVRRSDDGFALEIVLPEDMPLGAHGLEVESGEDRVLTTVLVAPRRVFARPGRRRGVFAPTYGLQSERSWGSGSLSDLERLAAWLDDLGGDVVATLPLSSCFLEGEAFDPSPYSPVSRHRWNALFVDVEAVPEVQHSSVARERIEDARDLLERLRDAPEVDHGTQMALQRDVLRAGLAWMDGQPSSPRATEFAAYLEADPEVVEYARFLVASERHGPWRAWDDPDEIPVPAGDDDVRLRAYEQWVAEEQLDALGASLDARGMGLYLDLPIGVHGDGWDAWAGRDVHVAGMAVGAPPDPFFSEGQNWAFPPLHPESSRSGGHPLFRRSLAAQMGRSEMLRVDHVMGLHRLYWIPDGASARDGVYVRYRADELYAALSLESHRHACHVVGENLGTVPPEVDEAMRTHGLSRMHVVEYELGGSHPSLDTAQPDTVASVNTHDMPTFAGFWHGDDIVTRCELGLLDDEGAGTERETRAAQLRALAGYLQACGWGGDRDDPAQVLDGLLDALRASPAVAATVALEDLWLERTPQNVPGTGLERPNWRHKLRFTLEDLATTPRVRRSLGRLLGRPVERNTMEPITADDLYLFNEGSHFTLHDVLGAHVGELDGIDGTRFAVWAPNAREVSVVGDFNDWTAGKHALEPLGSSGVWQGFVHGLGHGDLYKFHIRSREHGHEVEKADPFAFRAEVPPRTASAVWDMSYEWGDAAWMRTRAQRNALDGPMSVYELHPGSWRRHADGSWLTYRELAAELAAYVTEMGYTHVELTPVTEHPFYGSWGYQTTGYFAPTARFGTPQDFMYLVDHLHQHGIGVILDWVPSHFPADEHGLAYFDGTHLFEHQDPREGYHPDWNSWIFNYGRHEVVSFLISSALFWLDRYHVDGLRVDAVASMLYRDYSREEGEWVPNEFGGRENLEAIGFLRRLNEEVYRRHPDVQTFAEESTAWPMVSRPTYVGGLGFGLKWDMGWMHDTLEYMRNDPVHRRWHHHELTFRMVYAFNENFVLSLSHDEAVHGKGSLLGKMPGDDWQRFANLRMLHGYMHAMPGKKLLFMGGEFGQWDEWHHERSLDWHLLEFATHRGVQQWCAHLNRLHAGEPALHRLDNDHRGFEWIDANDADQSVLAFLRRSDDPDDTVLVVCNFTPVPRSDHRVGVPRSGAWREIANSDAAEYGGSGMGNLGGAEAFPVPYHGRPASLLLTLPPLSVVMFKWEPDR